MTSSKNKFRSQKENYQDLFGLFRNGPIRSQYWARDSIDVLRKREGRSAISLASLRRNFIKLKKKGYLKSTIGKRNAIQYSLTFKGFLYGLKIKSFTSKEAASIRKTNQLDLPVIAGFPDSINTFNHIEKTFPSTLYGKITEMIDVERMQDELLPHYFLVMSIITLMSEISENEELLKQYVKGDDLVAPDGTVLAEDYKNGFRMLRPVIKSILPKTVEKLIS